MYSLIFLIFLVSVQANDDSIVQTTYGPVKGFVKKTQNGHEFLAFYGIPYAAPPVGPLRLKPPVEPQPWSRVRNVTDWPSPCLQSDWGYGAGDEDCLYLNVFIPKGRLNVVKTKLPVMTFIYGGAFQGGSSSLYPADYITEKPVILVSLNYRLGSLGFMGFGTDEFSGNFGLKDQSLALKWIKNNIANFGGNPREVTIFGQSAGSASVHLHTVSPLSKDLFQRAIMQSGAGTSFWCFYDTDEARAVTTAFAVVTGCYRKNVQKMLTCLQKLKPSEFIPGQEKLFAWGKEPMPIFRPMIEGDDVKDAAIPKKITPKSYHSPSIPWIIGMNSGEGVFRLLGLLENEGKWLKEMIAEHKRLLPLVLSYQFGTDPEKIEHISDELKKYYFRVNVSATETEVQLVKILTDIMFLYPLQKALAHYPGKKYFYIYDYKVNCTAPGTLGCYKEEYGINHSEELAMMFPQSSLPFNKMTEAEKILSQKIVQFWTNFATYSDPNGLDEKKIWQPVTSEEGEYLHITSKGMTMEKGYRAEESAFLKKLFN